MGLERLHEAFDVNWQRVMSTGTAVLASLQMEAWEVAFYDEEPDSTPPLWPDRPLLDMRRDAMRCRLNRKAKLLKALRKM